MKFKLTYTHAFQSNHKTTPIMKYQMPLMGTFTLMPCLHDL